MQKGFTQYDKSIDASTSSEDDSYPLLDINTRNSRVSRFGRGNRSDSYKYTNEHEERPTQLGSSKIVSQLRTPVNNTYADTKLLCQKYRPVHHKKNQIAESRRYRTGGSLEQNYEETLVTTTDHSSEEGSSGCNPGVRVEKGTPPIVNVDYQHNVQQNANVDVPSLRDFVDNKGKSSVVVLYNGKKSLPNSSRKSIDHSSKSEQSIVKESFLRQVSSNPENSSPTRPNSAESPRYSSANQRRRRNITRRKYRQAPKNKEPLKLNIYQESRRFELNQSPGVWNTLEGIESRSSRAQKYIFKPEADIPNKQPHTLDFCCYKHLQEWRDRAKSNSRRNGCHVHRTCQPSKHLVSTSELMADYPSHQKKIPVERENQAKYRPNLGSLMQNFQSSHLGETGDNCTLHAGDSKEVRRSFPFQPTPSGHLKIIPNQVVYESKKLSVLVADPRHTKINIKADPNKSCIDVERVESDQLNKQVPIDCIQNIPSSIGDQVTRRRLQSNGNECRPKILPTHRGKLQLHNHEMEDKHTGTVSSSNRPLNENEVPLSSLGFTSDQPIDWTNVILPEKSDLYKELAKRITSYKNADYIVRIDHDEFHCHQLVLESYSTFFDERNVKEVDLTGFLDLRHLLNTYYKLKKRDITPWDGSYLSFARDLQAHPERLLVVHDYLSQSSVTSKAFSTIYDWMISSANESCQLLRRDNILEIFTASQYLGIKELEEQCWAFIDNDELFTEDTAFLLYLEARKIGNTAVMELMIPRIMKFFLILVNTKDFLELQVAELCNLLKSNYICVSSEMEVLMSAVRWLRHNWEERQQYMLEVLKCVRFGLITPWQLVDVKRNPENPEFIELMSYPEVQKMVDDALAFVIIKYWYGTQSEDYYHWIDLLGLTEPTNRNWVGEDKHFVTYREFLLYLDEYQKLKIPEIKVKKSDKVQLHHESPPNEPSPQQFSRPRPAYPVGNKNPETNPMGQGGAMMGNSRSSKHPPKGTGNFPTGAPPGTMMPPDFLSQYLTSLSGRNGSKGIGSTGDGEKRHSTGALDLRLNGGETPKKIGSLKKIVPSKQKSIMKEENNPTKDDIRREKIHNAVYHCQHPPEPNLIYPKKKQLQPKIYQEPELLNGEDSARSAEEAATTIQALYRGYRARRCFDKIRKSASEDKPNTRKVAELLAIPIMPNNLHKPLESVKILQTSASQGKNEIDDKNQFTSSRKKRKNSPSKPGYVPAVDHLSPTKDLEGITFDVPASKISVKESPQEQSVRAMQKPIETIKSPAFLNNSAEKISTGTVSESTDTSDESLSSPNDRSTMDLPTRRTFYNQNTAFYSKNEKIGDAEQCQIGNYLFTPKARTPSIIDVHKTRDLPKFVDTTMLDIEDRCFRKSVYYSNREAVLVLGGIDPHEDYGRSGNTGKDMYRFKPSENTWEFVGEIPEPRHHHSVAYLKGRIYLVGGADPRDDCQRRTVVIGTVWSYDPMTKIWYNEPGMLTSRQNFGLVVSHDKMYAIGGQDKNGIALKSVEVFDPSKGIWREVQSMHTARFGPACSSYQNLIWVAGGITKSKIEAMSKDVECYDPLRNHWTKGKSLRFPRCFATMYVMSDRLFVIGGAGKMRNSENSVESLDSIDVWDPNLCAWQQQTEMTIPRHGHATGFVGDRILIIGGVTTAYMSTLTSVEGYCFEIDQWSNDVCDLPYPISGHGSVTLPPIEILTNS